MAPSRSSFRPLALSLLLSGPHHFAAPFSPPRGPFGARNPASLQMSTETETEPETGRGGGPLPSASLPPPLLSTTPGTWAYDTMSRRVDSEILQRTYEENEAEFGSPGFEAALSRFDALRSELRDASNVALRYPETPGEAEMAVSGRAEEVEEWRSILEPFVTKGDTWLSAPWMVAEFYVYRRLVEALGYWDPSNGATHMYDPFAKAKRAGLETSVASAENVMGKVTELPKTREGAGLAAAFALWGNKMDLSIWPADAANAGKDVFAEILQAASENLLHDDTEMIEDLADKMREKGGGNVDIIVDNAGFELVMDLALADHLVDAGVAKTVTFQLKSHPTFVSDALEKDLRETVQHYIDLDPDAFPNAHKAGLRWQGYLDDGKWLCNEHNFWAQGSAMWDMPSSLRSDLSSRCDLAFVKGDANYRRLLGDRDWSLTVPFQEVVGSYFPCPVCALRTLKAEIGCGMDADQVERAKGLDDEWMVNGRFGVVQVGTGVGGATSPN